MNIFQELFQKYKTGNLVIKIIFLVILFNFSLVLVDYLFFAENKGVLYSYLRLNFGESFLLFPFSLFTYAFVSPELISMAFSLFAFYYIGQLFLSHFRERDFLIFLFLGIVGSGIGFLLFSFLFNQHLVLSGLTPTIFCLLFAIIAYQPKISVQLFFINISFQLQYIGYFLLGVELLSWFFSIQNYIPLVHILSAGLGFFYMKQFEVGNDFIGSTFDKLHFKKKVSSKIFDKKPPRDDYEYQDLKAEKQKRLDEILEKISAKGYDSLTKDEKKFLFKASK